MNSSDDNCNIKQGFITHAESHESILAEIPKNKEKGESSTGREKKVKLDLVSELNCMWIKLNLNG